MRRPLLAITILAAALQAVDAQQSVPIRPLAPVVEKTVEPIGLLGGFKQLPDGRVLVNDVVRRRLIVFSATLATFTVSADTMGAGAPKYTSQMIAGLYSYAGDSVLWADLEAQAFIVIAPNGKIARALAPPRPLDLTNLQMQYAGRPGSDQLGRFIYRAKPPRRPPADTLAPRPTRDTVNIVRASFDTRAVDTIAFITAPLGQPTKSVTDPKTGKISATMFVNPVPAGADDWAVLSDGSVAMVRAHDYHIDWLYPNGTRNSTPKMPFDWRRLTDEDKKAKVDSVRRLSDSLLAAGRFYGIMYMSVMDGAGGFKRDSVIPTIDFVPYSEMADYVQPLRRDALKPDADGNLWILPSTSSQAKDGLLYDVVNKKGELFERVQLPKDRDIAGFGKGGIVYLIVGDRVKGFIIEKTTIVRPVNRSEE